MQCETFVIWTLFVVGFLIHLTNLRPSLIYTEASSNNPDIIRFSTLRYADDVCSKQQEYE